SAGTDQCGSRSKRSENLPVIGDPYRDARLRIGGIHLHEGPLGIELDPFQTYAADELGRLSQFLLLGIGQIRVVASKHLHRIQPSRLEILDGLCKRIGPLRAALHPQELVADRIAITRIASLDSAVTGDTSGGAAS